MINPNKILKTSLLTDKSYKRQSFLISKNNLSNTSFILSSSVFSQLNKSSAKLNCIIHYGDRLAAFVNWYKQLWTESIGKNKYGLHLITAVGSNDQHSQLQMWLDGPDNLIYTLVIPKRRIVKFRTSNNKKNLPDYLQEKDMGNKIVSSLDNY